MKTKSKILASNCPLVISTSYYTDTEKKVINQKVKFIRYSSSEIDNLIQKFKVIKHHQNIVLKLIEKVPIKALNTKMNAKRS